MEHVRSLIEALAPRLEGMVKTDTVVGDPIQVQGKTLIPLMQVTFGMFGGGAGAQGEGQGKAKQGEGTGRGEGKGGGTGGGLKLTPVAVVCIDEAGMSVFPISAAKGVVGAIADAIPQIIAQACAAKKEKETASDPDS